MCPKKGCAVIRRSSLFRSVRFHAGRCSPVPDGLPGNLLFAALLVAAVHHVVVGDRLAGFPDLDVLLSEAPVGADRELARMVAAAALRAIGRGLRRGAVRLVFGEGVVAADRNLQLLVEELLRKGGIGVEVVARLAAQVCAAAVVSFAQRNGGRFPERDVHVEVLVEGELLGGDLLLGQPVVAVTAPPVQREGELLRGGVVDRKPCAGRALAHVVAVRRVRDALVVDARPARNAVVRQVARQGEGAAPFGGEIVVFERQRMCRRCFQIGVALRGIVRVAVVEVGRQHRDRGTA